MRKLLPSFFIGSARRLVLLLLLLMPALGWGQGSESFTNLPLTGVAYSSATVPGSYTGDNGVVWNYLNSRGDIAVNGKAIMLRSATGASVYSTAAPGGLATLTFSYIRPFSTAVNARVAVNGTTVGTITTTSDALQVFSLAGQTFVGNVSISITVNAGGGQVAIDDIAWTGYAGTAPTVTGFTPGSGPAGTVVTLTGTGYAAGTGVSFNGTAATAVTVVSPTSIQATVPVGATTGPISVSNANGSATSASSFAITTSPTVFYAKAAGDLNQPATFAANADGSGGAPPDFTTPGITYNVVGANRTIGGNWTVSGTGSKVVLTANSSLIIPASAVFTGPLDQLANSTLIIQNTAAAAYTAITQGVQDASSTIDFAQAGSYNVPASSVFRYQNLKLTNGTKTLARNTTSSGTTVVSTVVPGSLTLDNTTLGGNTSAPYSSINLTGSLTLVNGAAFATASASRIILNLRRATPQTITGNGSDILLFELNAYTAGGGAMLADAGGTTNLELGNSVSGGYYLETGTTLALNANTLRFSSGGKAVIFVGANAGEGLGTVTPTAASSINLETASNFAIGTLRLTSGATTISNFRLSAFGDALEVPSDLTVNGVLTLANGSLVVGDGSTPATLTLNGTVVNSGSGRIAGSAATSLVVGGTGALGTLIFDSNANRFNNFTMNRLGGSLALGSPLTVGGALTLTSGIIATTSTNVLALAATGTLAAPAFSGAGGSSFVRGPFRRTLAAVASPVSVVFPIGKGAAYRPLTLNVAAQASTTTYTAEQFEAAPPTSTLGTSGLTRVSSVRYFAITPTAQPTGFSGTVTIPFGVDDYANVPAELVVAKRAGTGSEWLNIGGTGTSGGSGAGNGAGGSSVAGFVESGSFTAFSDFALATTNAAPNVNPLVGGVVPLPVELAAFSAQRSARQTVALQWRTASEQNSARFEVQRSLDGREFATIAMVAARGNSTQATIYAALDQTAPMARLYYRLRQVDLDGSAAFSPVITTGGLGESVKVLLYPNPAHGRIHFTTEAATAYRVLNQLGQPLLRGTTEAGPASIGLEALPTGLYFLELQTAVGRTVQKFEKTTD